METHYAWGFYADPTLLFLIWTAVSFYAGWKLRGLRAVLRVRKIKKFNDLL